VLVRVTVLGTEDVSAAALEAREPNLLLAFVTTILVLLGRLLARGCYGCNFYCWLTAAALWGCARATRLWRRGLLRLLLLLLYLHLLGRGRGRHRRCRRFRRARGAHRKGVSNGKSLDLLGRLRRLLVAAEILVALGAHVVVGSVSEEFTALHTKLRLHRFCDLVLVS